MFIAVNAYNIDKSTQFAIIFAIIEVCLHKEQKREQQEDNETEYVGVHNIEVFLLLD